jgi:hypothetical protein
MSARDRLRSTIRLGMKYLNGFEQYTPEAPESLATLLYDGGYRMVSLEEDNLRRVAANYYNARPDHLKFQRIPTFDNMSGYLQREFIDLVRGVLEAAMQEES